MKYFLLFLIGLFSANAYASWDPKSGNDGACLVEKKHGKRFYFCGPNTGSCAGYNARSGHTQRQYMHKQTVTSKNNSSLTYWCCDGTTNESGHFVLGNKWLTIDETVTVELESGGTCNYKKQINICGIEESKPCTIPDRCLKGTILRNEECVAPCGRGYAFENDKSNTCIECETTLRQAIVSDICVTCTESQIFDKKAQKCVEKSDMVTISKTEFRKCWRCPDVYYNDCVKIMKETKNDIVQARKLYGVNKNVDVNKMIEQCKLDE